MKDTTSEARASLILMGLFSGLFVFAAAFSIWSNRHGAAAGRLEALREEARIDASHMSDAMRGLQVSAPQKQPDDEEITRPRPKLRGRCLVLNLNRGNLHDARLPVADYNSWVAKAWRAQKPEDVSFVIWLDWPQVDSGGYWMYFDSSGKLVGTSSREWNDDNRERCRVIVTRLDGEILFEVAVAAKALNGPIPELRSFEASFMQEIAKILEEDLWSEEILRRFQSPGYKL